MGLGGVNTMISRAEIYFLFGDPTPLIVAAMWRIEVVIVILISVYKKTMNVKAISTGKHSLSGQSPCPD